MAEIKELWNDSGFVLAAIAAGMFITYLVDVQKGLVNIIKLGDPNIEDIEGITLFYYVPGFFSIMLPALYLGRGIMLYRTVYCIINIASFIALGILVIAIAYARDSMAFLYTATVINGFITNSCMPLCYEIVTETGYPRSETLSAGAVHAVYAFFRIILKLINHLIDDTNSGIESTAYCFVLIILVFMSFVLMFFARVKHRRLKMELKAEIAQI